MKVKDRHINIYSRNTCEHEETVANILLRDRKWMGNDLWSWKFKKILIIKSYGHCDLRNQRSQTTIPVILVH